MECMLWLGRLTSRLAVQLIPGDDDRDPSGSSEKRALLDEGQQAGRLADGPRRAVQANSPAAALTPVALFHWLGQNIRMRLADWSGGDLLRPKISELREGVAGLKDAALEEI